MAITYDITAVDYGGAIRQICRMVGHPVPVDPAGSTDPAVIQMGAAINASLTEMLGLSNWSALTKQGEIIVTYTSPVEEWGFPLPVDFFRFVDQTQWGTDAFLPAIGPVSPQGWMTFIAQNVSPVIALTWQKRERLLFFLKPPVSPAQATFKFMYISVAQVVDQDNTSQFKNVATKNGDTFLLPGYLIALYGRAKYLEWKGFDSSAAYRDFWSAFNSVLDADKGAPVLSISGRHGVPFISAANVPLSGYGTP
jgi:hypothetical protein